MKIVVITGQTATGKTKLALDTAGKYGGELVNCDSRQIYKCLDIVTGKDEPVDTKIWLYDIVDPRQYFSSFDYVQAARPVIENIIHRGKTPIIVGGTYLYLKHLLYGINIQTPPNWKLRKEMETKTVRELQEIVKKLSTQSFKQMNRSDPNNPHRLIRRMEILQSTPSLSSSPSLPSYSFKIIGLKYKNRNDLVNAIKIRVEKRLKQGALGEVKRLLEKGYTENDPGLKTIGYQQIIRYLKGKITINEAANEWVVKEIQYAKRQYTFMKKDKNISWKEI